MKDTSVSKPSLRNIIRWFDPRANQMGSFAFIMNRISGIGLTIYLFAHLIVLSQLARGPQAYNQFIAVVKNPFFTASEYVVVMGVLLHGLNGLRIAITSFALGVPYQRRLFYAFMFVAIVGCIYFGIRMFGGGKI
jgi:succinate dehydrogenase / fumarate reductase cytochrome b subunit